MWPFGIKDKEKRAALDAQMEQNRANARAPLLWKQGTRYMERRRYDRALDCFRDAFEIQPSLLEGRLNMGAAYFLNGQAEEALPHLKYVLAIEPKNTVALLNIAATYDALGDIDNSIKALEELVHDRPNWRDANYNLAVAYVKQERWDDATQALRRELTLNPKHEAARTLLNDVHLKPRKNPRPETVTES